jgi:hypothetical protein
MYSLCIYTAYAYGIKSYNSAIFNSFFFKKKNVMFSLKSWISDFWIVSLQVLKALRTHTLLRRLVLVPVLNYAILLLVCYFHFSRQSNCVPLNAVIYHVIRKVWLQTLLSFVRHPQQKLREEIKTTEDGDGWVVLV